MTPSNLHYNRKHQEHCYFPKKLCSQWKDAGYFSCRMWCQEMKFLWNTSAANTVRETTQALGILMHGDWDASSWIQFGGILTDWIRCCAEGTSLICAEWSPCESGCPGHQPAQFQTWVGRGLSGLTWEKKMRKFPLSHLSVLDKEAASHDSTRWSMMTSYYRPWWNLQRKAGM